MDSLLIIDDVEEIRQQLKWGLSDTYRILLAADVSEALRLFNKDKPSVVMIDLGLPPDIDGASEGLRCLEEMLRIAPLTKAIIVSGNDQREYALQAIQLGAYDFYQKPIDLGELKVILARAFHLYELEKENRELQRKLLESTIVSCGLYGDCPAMQNVQEMIDRVGDCDVPVLILGESGTGKELVARAVHARSSRSDNEFMAINCGAIPENLLESELFGHEKGAFTGAHSLMRGKFEYANKGTLFLDEIGEMPTNLQVKLLRFLQEQVFQRVGGHESISVDTRIVAATNVDMEAAIREGRVREDLYYRIGVITIDLPPLRERGDDTLLLARMFVQRFSGLFSKDLKQFSKDAEKLIRTYRWPGNVREMENKIKRAVIMSTSGLIESADLGFGAQISVQDFTFDGLSLKEARENLEEQMVRAALEKQRGNVVKVAEQLRVSRPTVYDLMKKFNLGGKG